MFYFSILHLFDQVMQLACELQHSHVWHLS